MGKPASALTYSLGRRILNRIVTDFRFAISWEPSDQAAVHAAGDHLSKDQESQLQPGGRPGRVIRAAPGEQHITVSARCYTDGRGWELLGRRAGCVAPRGSLARI